MKIEIRGVERLSFRERQVVVLKEMGLATGEITKRLGLGARTRGNSLQSGPGKGIRGRHHSAGRCSGYRIV